jgi:serine/threonine protein phosphatase PrpC
MTDSSPPCLIAADAVIGGRSEQQDGYAIGAIPLENGEAAPLVVLADGMGGEAAGREASEIAVAAFLETAQGRPATDVPLRLREALLDANRAIAARVENEPALAGMGCTLIGLAFADGRASWVSVGDSLILRLTEEGAVRVNEDHSMAPALAAAVDRGEMSVAEARHHPQRSLLLSAVTGRPLDLVDEQSVELGGEDGFVIASDGLLTLDSASISRIAGESRGTSPQALVSALLAAVEEAAHPFQDNTTIVAVRPGAGACEAWAGGG